MTRRIGKIRQKRTGRKRYGRRQLDSEHAKTDLFDWIPDSVILLIFNRIGDFKTLCRCCAVSKRFNDVATQVDNVVLKINYSMLDWSGSFNQHSVLGLICTMMDNNVIYSQLSADLWRDTDPDARPCIPVFKKFKEIRVLKFVLPVRKGGFDNGVLLKWKAEFGPSFRKCVVLSACSQFRRNKRKRVSPATRDNNSRDDFSNRRYQYIFNAFASGFASFDYDLRKYMRKVIAEISKLDTFVLTDTIGGGVLSMTGLQELTVPSDLMVMPYDALNNRSLRANKLSLTNGVELNGVQLNAIWLKELSATCDLANTFKEPYQACLGELMSMRSDSLLHIGPL